MSEYTEGSLSASSEDRSHSSAGDHSGLLSPVTSVGSASQLSLASQSESSFRQSHSPAGKPKKRQGKAVKAVPRGSVVLEDDREHESLKPDLAG